MNIEFTREQYERLIRLVYLGNWMVNANRSNRKGDEQIKEYNDMEQYIFSFAKNAGLSDLIEYDKELKGFFPTRKFDEDAEVGKYREEYDDHAFWDGLFYQFYERDFTRAYTRKEILAMDIHELFEKEEPFRQKWDNEIIKHGIERLEIKEK